MVSRTSPQEKVVAVVASVRLRIKEASVSIVAQRLGAVLAVAHAETDAGISLPLRVGIVDIHRSVSSALGIGPELGTSEIATPAVFLQYDVDDSGRALRAVFRRWVGDYLYSLNRFSRNLFENLRPVVGGKTRLLAVNPHGNRTVAAKRHLAVLIHLYRWYGLKQLACRLAGGHYVGIDVEHLLVKFKTHLGTDAFYHYLLQQLGVVGKTQSAKVDVRSRHCNRPFLVDVPYARHPHYVFPVLHSGKAEPSVLVGVGTDGKRLVGLRVYQLHSGKRNRVAAPLFKSDSGNVAFRICHRGKQCHSSKNLYMSFHLVDFGT